MTLADGGSARPRKPLHSVRRRAHPPGRGIMRDHQRAPTRREMLQTIMSAAIA